jgi:hypothetical protein
VVALGKKWSFLGKKWILRSLTVTAGFLAVAAAAQANRDLKASRTLTRRIEPCHTQAQAEKQ